MKDSSISKYHLFSGVSVMVIAYLTITTVVLYLKCFKLYVPDFLDEVSATFVTIVWLTP